MLYFILRRVLQMIPTVVAVSLLIFIIFSVVPGSIASGLIANGKGMNDPKMVEKLHRNLGSISLFTCVSATIWFSWLSLISGHPIDQGSRLFRLFRSVCGRR